MKFILLSLAVALSSPIRAGEHAAPSLGALFSTGPHATSADGVLFPDSQVVHRKSKVAAGFYSALLPGMGELYGGAYDVGKYFTASEVVLWLAYVGMTVFGNAMIDDAATYAQAHAGAATGGKDDQFLTNVGNFLTTAQYNDKKARDGDFRLIYTAGDYQWRWDSEANRSFYRDLHVRANALIDKTKYFVAAIVVNHFASAIDAVLQVNKLNKAIQVGAAPRYEFGSWGTVMEVAVRL